MERTNGAMSKTTTEVGGVIDSRHFGLSKFNYIFDNFATTPQTPNTETKKANARMMWEMVEDVFQGIRTVMSTSGRARSGSFRLTWSSAVLQFWEVKMLLL